MSDGLGNGRWREELLPGVGLDEPLPELVLITATAEDLIPAPKLEEISASQPNCKFRMVEHYKEYHNTFNITPLEVLKLGTDFQLQEAIMDVLELEGADLERAPEARDVVLGLKNGVYKRALLLKMMTEDEFLAYFVDAGGKGIVRVDQLKPVSKAIMTFPILSYHVTLKGVKPTSSLTLKKAFSSLMGEINTAKTEFTIKLGDHLKGAQGKFAPTHNLILSYEMDGEKRVLNEEINDLETWEWERSSDGKGSDNDLCKNGRFGSQMRAGNEEDALIVHYSMKVGTKFTAMVSRVEKDESNRGEAVIVVTLLDDPDYRNCFDVLHSQLERFSATIRKSKFFPALQERLMFKLITRDETREKYTSSVKIVDRWCRGLRIGDSIYLLDTDDTIPFRYLPPSDYEIRRIYGEFFQIPILTVRLRVKWKGKSIPYGAATDLLQRRKRYAFEITSDADRVIYEAELCSENPPK